MRCPLSECPVRNCGCEACEFCREHHDEETACRCECDFERDERTDPAKPAEPDAEATARHRHLSLLREEFTRFAGAFQALLGAEWAEEKPAEPQPEPPELDCDQCGFAGPCKLHEEPRLAHTLANPPGPRHGMESNRAWLPAAGQTVRVTACYGEHVGPKEGCVIIVNRAWYCTDKTWLNIEPAMCEGMVYTMRVEPLEDASQTQEQPAIPKHSGSPLSSAYTAHEWAEVCASAAVKGLRAEVVAAMRRVGACGMHITGPAALERLADELERGGNERD